MIPIPTRCLRASDKKSVRVNLEFDFTGQFGLFKHHLRNADTLRITNLNDLSFHNYIVITSRLERKHPCLHELMCVRNPRHKNSVAFY